MKTILIQGAIVEMEKRSANDTFGCGPSTQEAELEPTDWIRGWIRKEMSL